MCYLFTFCTPPSCLNIFLSLFVSLHLLDTQGVKKGICQILEKVVRVNFHRRNQTHVPNVLLIRERESIEETLLLAE